MKTSGYCKLKLCKRRHTCKRKEDPFKNNTLCWGYKKYINQDKQDYIKYEVLFSDINMNLERIDSPLVNYYLNINKKIEIIKLFFFCRMDIDEIARQLQCSKQYVYNQIKLCKKAISNYIVDERAKKKGKAS